MKFKIYRLKVGDLVWASIEEKISSSEFIISFQGDLVRVSNLSSKIMSAGERVLVRVTHLEPLAFQLVDSVEKNNTFRYDVSI